MKGLLALAIVAVLGVWGLLAQGHPSQSSNQAARAAAPEKPRPRRATMHYTVAERLLIDSIDVAAGKAMRAATSPDGLFEQRTSRQWCGVALDAEDALVRRHSLTWATRVDRARDTASQKFQDAAKACG